MSNLLIDKKHGNVVIIGAGIGGLTAAALLARRGYKVKVFDQAIVPGGCASTFQRQGFTFDVGATQVAGLEPGGIHYRIFSELNIDLPTATPCDPACAVYLPGESNPINVWRDPQKWKQERERQFPGSADFWQLLTTLFNVSWQFQSRDPVLPPRNLWDLGQLVKSLRINTLITVPFTLMTVGDALRLYGLNHDQRLRTFLDLQLKLYSQVSAEETALLYAATALNVSQTPQGLYHLQGSMQVLSDRLLESLKRDGGQLYMRHSVKKINVVNKQAESIVIKNQKNGETFTEKADHIIGNVTVQNLVQLLGENAPKGYKYRVEKLPPASGAYVLYLGVDASAIPPECPPHLQFMYDINGLIGENNSLFVSVSHPEDGRAPKGKATIIASSFVDYKPWWHAENYQELKQKFTQDAIAKLSQYFYLKPETLILVDAATPRTFFKYTGRDRGIVGGIGQRIATFGPFGFANRTPIKNLWLVGDSTHPGEGTAGVSYSALTVVRQIDS
jgi:C-3',4' desaturase CrtD